MPSLLRNFPKPPPRRIVLGTRLLKVAATTSAITLTVANVAQAQTTNRIELEGDWISLVGGSEIQGSADGITSWTPQTWPTNLKTGDTVVLYVSNGTTNPVTPTVTAPGGASYVTNLDVLSGTTLRLTSYLRRIASDGEAAPTIAVSTASTMTCVGQAYRNVNATTPLDTTETSANTTATATNVTLPNQTTVTAKDWSLAGYAVRGAAPPYANLTPGSGFTERVERLPTTGSGLGVSNSINTRDTSHTGPIGASATIGGEIFSHDIAGGARQIVIHTLLRKAPASSGLTVQDVAQAQTTTTIPLNVPLIVQNVAQAQTTTTIPLNVPLIVQNVAQAQTTDNIVLQQVVNARPSRYRITRPRRGPPRRAMFGR